MLPTPTAQQWGSNTRMRQQGKTVASEIRDWPTPRAIYGEHPGMKDPRHLTGAVQQPVGTDGKTWPTPTAADRKRAGNHGRGPSNPTLAGAVQNWPTPVATDGSQKKGPRGELIAAIRGWKGKQPAAPQVWPTPRASRGEHRQTKQTPSQAAGKHGQSLGVVVKMFPSPAARDWRSGAGRKENGHTPQLPEVIAQEGNGGQLNPDWVEWLMGWPIGWTGSKRLATAKFQQWQRQHGGS